MHPKRTSRPALVSNLYTLSKIITKYLCLVCCLYTGTDSFSQVIDPLVISSKSKHRTEKLDQCELPYLFLSDTLSATYYDRHPRNSVYTICPQYPQQRVSVLFQTFDLLPEDTLFVYNGFTIDAPLLGKATGQGVEAAFGGQIVSPFSREENPTSCLTFHFRTNGDEISGAGWVATAQCVERNLAITLPYIPTQQFTCEPNFAVVTIEPAQVFSPSGSITNDSTLVRIKDGITGTICQEAVLSLQANTSLSYTFSLGMYVVEYISLLDQSVRGSTRFEVIAPALACQEQPNILSNSNCELTFPLDQLLTDYCAPEAGIFHYNMVVKDAQNNIVLHGTTLEEQPFVLTQDKACNTDYYIVEIQKEYTNSIVSCSSSRFVQNCTTRVSITNQVTPIFEEAPQTYQLRACEVNLSEVLGLLPTPSVSSVCGNLLATIESTAILNSPSACPDQETYVITWKATDSCERSTRRFDTLEVKRPILISDISTQIFPLNCEDYNAQTIPPIDPPALVTGITINNQFQPFDTVFLSTSATYCGYQVVLQENRPTDKCSKEIIRYWSLLDFCSIPSTSIPLDTQIIRLVDLVAPSIQCTAFSSLDNAEEIILPTNSCQTTLAFPLPSAIDNCDIPIVKEFTFEKLVNNREWSRLTTPLIQTPLGVGTYRVGYEVVNDCNITDNRTVCFRYFTIKDTTAPTINCKESPSIQLGINGTAVLTAAALNTNSTDNCGISQLLIRKSLCPAEGQPEEAAETPPFTDYLEQVFFNCCDISNTVQVELLAVDDSGNASTCQVAIEQIQSTDQGSFTFIEPIQTYTLTACDFDLLQVTSMLPRPAISGICGASAAQIETTIILSNDTSCDDQSDFLIQWQATDNFGNVIRRIDTLKVERPSLLPTATSEPITIFCDQNIDQSSGFQAPSLLTGITIKGQFQVLDTIFLSYTETVCDFELSSQLESASGKCNEQLNRIWSIKDLCATPSIAIPIDTQKVQLLDTIAPVISCTNFTNLENAETIVLPVDACLTAISFPLPNITDNCDPQPLINEFTVERLREGNWVNISSTLAAISFGIGTYRVGYASLDACGNITQNSCYRFFSVVDNSFPIASCQQNLLIELDQQGEALLTREAINDNSSDNCGIAEISIRRSLCPLTALPADTEPDTNEIPFGEFTNQVRFDCCDVGGTALVELRVKDMAGNTSTCQTQVTRIVAKDANQFTFVDPVQNYILTACDFDLLTVLSTLPTPAVRGICEASAAQIEATSILTENTRCDDQADFLIIWQATDELGDTIRRIDTLKIERPSISQMASSEAVTIVCDQNNTNPNNVNFQPPSLLTGLTIGGQFLILDTLFLSLTEPVCDFKLSYEQNNASTSCMDAMNRVWFLTDLCATPNLPVPIDTQKVQFVDTIAPTIRCSEFASSDTAQPFYLKADACSTLIAFSLPHATDDCDKNPTVREFIVEQLINDTWTSIGMNLLSTMIGPGIHRVGYEAVDNCGETNNRSTCFRYFTVIDSIAPIANCDQDLLIELDDLGMAILQATDLDDNSFDNCGIEILLTKRSPCEDADQRMDLQNDTLPDIDLNDWSPNISFECCDLAGDVTIDLLVIDSFNNFSTCQIVTKVVDPILPACAFLAPAVATCQEYEVTDLGRPTDLNANNQFDETEWLPLLANQENFYNNRFGNVLSSCRDNALCLPPAVKQEYQLLEGTCGSILLKRRYRAIDKAGNQSPWIEQIITVNYQPDWTLVLPADTMTNCAINKIEDPKSPIQNGTCDDLVWNFRDSIIRFDNGTVQEICRTFNIVNRCLSNNQDGQWTPIPRPENEQGVVSISVLVNAINYTLEDHLTYTQKIRIIDNDAPFLVIQEVDNLIRGKGDSAPFGEEDQQLGVAPFECDEIKEFAVLARDCNEPSTLSLLYNWEFFRNDQLIEIGTGNTFRQVVVPDSTYVVNWSASDLFGNQSDTTITYRFTDGAPPTTQCKQDVQITIDTETRKVTLYADSLNSGTFDNCDDQLTLGLFLWHESLEIDTPTVISEINQLPDSIILSCIDTGLVELVLYGTDQSNNFSSCTARIDILDNPSIDCDETMLSGSIVNRFGHPINGAGIAVWKEGQSTNVRSNDIGQYTSLLPTQQQYTIRPFFDKHPLNGVSTYDIILLNKHIIGEKIFDSPYQYIAADVNRSGHITVFDAVQIRQLILNKTEVFPNSKSWRFVNADYQFTSNRPLQENFPESYDYQSQTPEHLRMDFVGVKMGDINGNADTYNLSPHSQTRNFGTTIFLYTDQLKVEKGKTYQIPIHAPTWREIIGLQTTFKFHDLILTNFIGGIVTSEQVHGWRKEQEGFLTTSWHSSLLSHDKHSSRLFTLTMTATKDGLLEELLTITSSPTPTEAYSLSGNRLGLQLAFAPPLQKELSNTVNSTTPLTNSEDIASMPISSRGGVFQLFQNIPNPFSKSTEIKFHLPKSALTALSVFDVHGQNIYTITQHYETGTHSILLNSDQLPIGTYFYQVATPFGVATKKMTVIY